MNIITAVYNTGIRNSDLKLMRKMKKQKILFLSKGNFNLQLILDYPIKMEE